MHAVSQQRPSIAAHSSLQDTSGDNMSGQRPSLMKRQSSQSSHNSKHGALSPGSVGEYQPLRHHVNKPGKRAKILLPRNQGSGRNLAKMAQQIQNQQNGEEGRKAARTKSRESDTEIRLPRSFDGHVAPTLRRNFTATQLPRNTSHTKLKKNLSHGQLTKLGLNATASKGPPSPGTRDRNKRHKSADMVEIQKDLHEQEVAIQRQQQEKKDQPKKVGFAVGSSDDVSDDEDLPRMEGQGLQEDEWTDQSASASPLSTRQNTANNSRRASMVVEKPPDKPGIPRATQAQDHEPPPELSSESQSSEATETAEEDDEGEGEKTVENEQISAEVDEPASPRNIPGTQTSSDGQPSPIIYTPSTDPPSTSERQQRNVSSRTREHVNPATRHLLSRNTQSPAPALVSNVSALDVSRSGRTSPTASMTSSRSLIAGDGMANQDREELVSRFMPSGSHPNSGANTTSTTPKTGSLHTPESDNMMKSNSGFSIGPVSPESVRSMSFGPHTPSFSRFRNEERMLNEKALAEREDADAHGLIVPAHVFDRRNDTLKSYLNLASLGGDGRGGMSATTGLIISQKIFEGRFKAINTELKVVQRFRNPISESVSRLHLCKESEFAKLRSTKPASSSQKQATGLQISKSATNLPRQPSKLSTSSSPPKSASPVKAPLTSAKSATQIRRGESKRGKVSFSQAAPQVHELEHVHEVDGKGADAIARKLWEDIV